jgi:multidrug efflux pump
MSASHSQEKKAAESRNFSRYCVENPHISWVLLLGTVVWGIYGYTHMPQRRDPEIPIKQAMVLTPWPGASAEKVEDLVTRTVERTIASNSNVATIESTSRGNVSVVILSLSDNLKQTGQVLDDIGGRLAAIHDLPDGAGPINYVRDFGDTATLMLTVASPKADTAEIAVRAQAIRKAIEDVRKEPARGGSHRTPASQVVGQGFPTPAGQSLSDQHASLVFCFSPKTDRRLMRLGAMDFIEFLRSREVTRDLSVLEGPGFIGIDGETPLSDEQLLAPSVPD